MQIDGEHDLELEKIINQVFAHCRDMDISMIIFNDKAKLVWATEKVNDSLFGAKWQDFIGLGYDDAISNKVQDLLQKNKVDAEKFIEISKTKHAINIESLQSQTLQNYIELFPFSEKNFGQHRIIIPILNSKNESIGLQMISHEIELFDFSQLISGNDGKRYLVHNVEHLKDELKLTTRQLEILFLLANGISQEETAQILGIKRGTIGKILSSQICPKFNIAPPNTSRLLVRARLKNIDKIVPDLFWKNRVIRINQPH